jgi:hypothetical protein
MPDPDMQAFKDAVGAIESHRLDALEAAIRTHLPDVYALMTAEIFVDVLFDVLADPTVAEVIGFPAMTPEQLESAQRSWLTRMGMFATAESAEDLNWPAILANALNAARESHPQ